MTTAARRPRSRGLAVAGLLGVIAVLVVSWAAAGADPTSAFEVASFATVGLLLVWRRPREPIGWLLVYIAWAFVAVGSLLPGSASDIVDGRLPLGLTALAWFNAWSSSLFFDAVAALAAIFPTGRFPAGAMGRVAALAIAAPIVFGIALAFAPDLNPLFEDGTSGVVRNPIGLFEGWSGWPVIQAGVYVAVLASLMVSIGTFLVRYRRARGLERAQGKWLLGALSVMLAAVAFAFAVLAFVSSTGFWMWAPAALAYPLIPIAIGIAVMRYRLYEIDRIVSRTIGWAVSTGAILALFALLVIGLQAVLAPVTRESTLAVAASTLAAFALFQPLRHRVQSLVDHRFNRSRYDAERISGLLAARLRNETDLPAINAGIVDGARASVQPGSVALWVRGRA